MSITLTNIVLAPVHLYRATEVPVHTQRTVFVSSLPKNTLLLGTGKLSAAVVGGANISYNITAPGW